MKKRLLWIVAPILLFTAFTVHSGSPSSVSRGPLKIGSIIPKAKVKMENYGGIRISLHDAGRENGLLVVFSCNTCPAVVDNNARMMEAASYAMRNRVGVIFVNSNEGNRDGSDSKDMMKAYAEGLGYKWCYVIDKNSQIANEFGANFNPECYLFDKLGRLIYKGAMYETPKDESGVGRQHLEIAIEESVARKKVSVPVTEPVGCPIKRK